MANTLRPDIILAGGTVPNIEPALGRLQQFTPAARAEQRFLEESRAQNLERGRLDINNARTQQRIRSLGVGALEILPDLNAGNVSGTITKLRERRESLIAQGLPTNDTDGVIAELEAGNVDKVINQAQQVVRLNQQLGFISAPSQGEDFTLSEGQTRFTAEGDPIATVAPVKTDSQLEADLKRSKTRFDQASKIRGEVEKATKTFRDVEDSFSRVQASQDGEITAASDIALIFNFMKMLDPGSVVREGEFATAQNAAGVPERVVNQYNRLRS